MSPSAVHFIPIVTTLLAIPFALEIFRRYRAHPERLHLLWWALGIATYGVGTFTESLTSVFGWQERRDDGDEVHRRRAHGHDSCAGLGTRVPGLGKARDRCTDSRVSLQGPGVDQGTRTPLVFCPDSRDPSPGPQAPGPRL